MNITNAGSDIQMDGFRLNGEWEVYRTRAEWRENVLPCCNETRYPYVEFTLYLRRRHEFYVMNIIVPCTLLSVLVMIVFCLPPDAGEKISLGISVLLAFSVFLLMVAENIPRTSLHVPFIGMSMKWYRVTCIVHEVYAQTVQIEQSGLNIFPCILKGKY